MTRQMLGCHDPIEMTKTAARSCSSLSQRHACQANKYRLFPLYICTKYLQNKYSKYMK